MDVLSISFWQNVKIIDVWLPNTTIWRFVNFVLTKRRYIWRFSVGQHQIDVLSISFWQNVNIFDVDCPTQQFIYYLTFCQSEIDSFAAFCLAALYFAAFSFSVSYLLILQLHMGFSYKLVVALYYSNQIRANIIFHVQK